MYCRLKINKVFISLKWLYGIIIGYTSTSTYWWLRRFNFSFLKLYVLLPSLIKRNDMQYIPCWVDIPISININEARGREHIALFTPLFIRLLSERFGDILHCDCINYTYKCISLTTNYISLIRTTVVSHSTCVYFFFNLVCIVLFTERFLRSTELFGEGFDDSQ